MMNKEEMVNQLVFNLVMAGELKSSEIGIKRQIMTWSIEDIRADLIATYILRQRVESGLLLDQERLN
jgi:hypothetical protein